MQDLSKLPSKENILHPIGRLIIMIAATGAVVAFGEGFAKELIDSIVIRFGIYATILLVLYCILDSFNKALPKRPKKSLSSKAIVLAIESLDDAGQDRIDNTIVPGFREQIRSNDLSDLISVVSTDKHQSRRINACFEKLAEEGHGVIVRPGDDSEMLDEWRKIHNTIRGDLYIGGKIYKRELNKFVLDFEGHVDIDLAPDVVNEFKDDYQAVWIRTRLVEEASELEGFEVEIRNYLVLAKSFIAFIALYSGHGDVSHPLHLSLKSELEAAPHFPGKDRLFERTKKRLALEYFLNARTAYYYRDDIEVADKLIDLCLKNDPSFASGYLMKAILIFRRNRDTSAAGKMITKAGAYSPPGDNTWRYSSAFLMIYRKDYFGALNVYDYIINHTFKDEHLVINQVLPFFHRLLEAEPEFIEAHFVRGVLYGYKQNKYKEAIAELQLFKTQAAGLPKYRLLIQASERHLEKFRGLQQS